MAKTTAKGGFQFPKGGSGKMLPRTGATPAKAGMTSKSGSGQGAKWPQGGSGKMFGRRGSQAAKPGSTST